MKTHHSSRLVKMIVLLFAGALTFAGPLSSSAQTQFTGWLATFQNYKFSERTGLYFDGQLRSTGQLQQIHSILLRPGLNIYFNPSLTGTIGYAYIPQQRSSGGITGYLPEHRTWQQLVYTHSLHHRATLAHRLSSLSTWAILLPSMENSSIRTARMLQPAIASTGNSIRRSGI